MASGRYIVELDVHEEQEEKRLVKLKPANVVAAVGTRGGGAGGGKKSRKGKKS